MKKLLFALLFVASTSIGMSVAQPSQVSALTGADFNAGRIIDDALFFNPNTMSTDQVQNFMNSKVPSCDTNGTKPSSHYNSGAGRFYTRAEWGQLTGNPAPYTCVKDYKQDVPAIAADNYCKAIPSATGQTAAQIITTVGQACSMSPAAMLVLIQKEQALITDDWPWSSQYEAATGYGCPDSAPVCDKEYEGYFNQVYKAARQFQVYAKLPNSFSYRAGATSFVLYNPNTSCNGTNVTMQTQATAGLYNYTPYVPNSAALGNLQGTGDGCSAYGNRNFWVFYNNWFGSPTISTDPTQQAEAQRRIKTVATTTTRYTFYYDAFQRVLRLTSEDIASGTKTASILDGSSQLGGGRINADTGSSIDVVVYGNYLQAYYYDQTNGNLRHAWTDATGWHFETLDGDSSSVSKYSSDIGVNPSVTVHNGFLQLFYYDKTTGNLRHTWTNPNGWNFENLDGDPGSISRYDGAVGISSTVMSYENNLQLFYYDSGTGNLRHAWTGPGGWRFENLEGDIGSISRFDANIGMSPTVTSFNGFIQLFYYDSGSGNLRHAWTGPGGWRFENLDGDPGSIARHNSNVGINPSVGVLNGNIQLFYYDKANGNLRHVWTNVKGWNFENLDGDPGSIASENGDIGVGSSLHTTSGAIQTFYLNRSSGNLKRGYVDNTGWKFENLAPAIVY